jgi:ribose 1,5-bisphosphokinase PhnN
VRAMRGLTQRRGRENRRATSLRAARGEKYSAACFIKYCVNLDNSIDRGGGGVGK